MNSHQRRVYMRRKHMDLPLGAKVVVCDLITGSVFRHRRSGPYGIGNPNLVDVKMTTKEGREVVHPFPIKVVRLQNPADRHAKPWWAQSRHKP